ncbi:MAG: flagellar filament capping protein FliD [Bacillota bacterium]
MTSVSSSTNTTSKLTAKTGIGGLVSGMDIDSIVESMTATSREKITKQQQNLQRLEWKQTSYRSVTSKLKEFQSKYLDVLSSTNFRSTSFFNTVKATSSSDAVTVASTGSSTEGTITINSITQLATNQKINMAAGAVASKPLKSTNTVTSFIAGLEAGESISLTLDGKVKTITFDSAFVTAVTADPSTFESNLQTLVDNAFGATGVADRVVTVDVGGDDMLTFTAPGSKLTLNTVGDTSTTLTDLGFTSGQSNTLTTTTELGDLSFATALNGSSYTFKINDVTFSVSSSDSLASVMEKINSSSAGVTISYSSITDRFTMVADDTGSGDNIVINEIGGNLMTAFGLTSTAGAVVEDGVNAVLSVNGKTITRSSNTFEVDGVKVTLKDESATAVTLTMTEDATSLTDTIKSFVEDYNTMVDYINGLIKEEIDSDYQPLTDEQKEEMTETEITAWEKKAKSGILRGDGLLRSISSKLQSVVTGLSANGFSLYSMGITSAGYTENGKLQIDETKLKTALETKGSEIRELFTSTKGLGNSLNTIITDATKTSGVKGSRGTLVDVAGVDNTSSDTENSIFEQIKKTNKNIKTLKTRLEDEETRLWSKFTYMETIINNLNSQSSILSSYTSS